MTGYRRPVRFLWWTERRSYVLFVVRELTSLFVGTYAVLLLILVDRLVRGPTAYEAYLAFLGAPGMAVFHALGLAAALYHSVTWFALAPKAMTVRLGRHRVPDAAVVGANYAVWAIVSAVVARIVLGR
ncbi:MAG: fumarate reductase subunit C [Armatimonadota bacterium]|nr:fumarate reductase subunit C [Armatimonadota bacterium]MDR5696997.1 fumarate reductase subunit C [Armatimonadota bacterium]